MKKFMTAIPLQMRGGLKRTRYTSENNKLIASNEPYSFPILPVIAASTEPEEAIEIITICTDTADVVENAATFQTQLDEVQKKAGFSYKIKPLQIPHSETDDKHLALFSKLIESIDDEDELYACLTYGDKPTSLVMFLAINYAYKLKRASLETLVYGMIVSHAENKGVLYDITSLFYLNSIVEKAEVFGDIDSEKIAKLLLGFS